MPTTRSALPRLALLAGSLTLAASLAGAQAAPGKMDKSDRKEMKQDKPEMKQDKHEMKHEQMGRQHHDMEGKGDAIARMPWGPGPDFLPKGAKMHPVSGNPAAAGPFVIHLMFPNRYVVKPHSHPADEHVTVISGTFLYGTGDTFDRKALHTMRKGQEGTIPARMNHFATARGRTVVEISSTGPFQITYANAKDDPRGMKK